MRLFRKVWAWILEMMDRCPHEGSHEAMRAGNLGPPATHCYRCGKAL